MKATDYQKKTASLNMNGRNKLPSATPRGDCETCEVLLLGWMSNGKRGKTRERWAARHSMQQIFSPESTGPAYLLSNQRPGGLRPEETLHVPPRWPPFTRFSSFNHSTTINGDAVLSVLRIAGRQH